VEANAGYLGTPICIWLENILRGEKNIRGASRHPFSFLNVITLSFSFSTSHSYSHSIHR
jgi:hypothetical protein